MDRLGLVAALARLSSRQREAVALRYVVGLDDIETAAVLGVGVETARSHVRRGLTRLRLELSDTEELRHAAR
jgi:RNA polymerase sigma-70 factor (ECF subfamily)